MAESVLPLSFDDLTLPGAEGARLRDMIEQTARVGAIDAKALIGLAEILYAKGQPGLVFWALGIALSVATSERLSDVLFDRLALAAARLSPAPESPVDFATGRTAFFTAIDAMDEAGHTQCMTRLVSAMADDPGTAHLLATGGGNGETALGLRLAAALFNADIESARQADVALSRLSALRRWTWIARVKLALAEDAFARAAELCRTAIAAVGADAQLTCLTSVSQFCLGNRAEGHRWAARAGNFFAADHIALRPGPDPRMDGAVGTGDT